MGQACNMQSVPFLFLNVIYYLTYINIPVKYAFKNFKSRLL